MSTYTDLIKQAEQGQHVTPEQLMHAKAQDDHQAAEQALAKAQAKAQAQALKDAEAHDAQHLSVLGDMLLDLSAAQADMTSAYPAYQEAVKAFQDKVTAREAQYNALRAYVREHYGTSTDLINLATGEVDSHTYARPTANGLVVVNSLLVAKDGTTTQA